MEILLSVSCGKWLEYEIKETIILSYFVFNLITCYIVILLVELIPWRQHIRGGSFLTVPSTLSYDRLLSTLQEMVQWSAGG